MPVARVATLADAYALAPRLRKADQDEAWAAGGQSPLEALTDCVGGSRYAFAIEHDGLVLAIFGGADGPAHLPGVGVPWLLASDDLLAHRRWFARNSLGIVEMVARHYATLWNLVDTRNVAHVRWLAWCGFELGAIHTGVGFDPAVPLQEFKRTA